MDFPNKASITSEFSMRYEVLKITIDTTKEFLFWIQIYAAHSVFIGKSIAYMTVQCNVYMTSTTR